MIDDVMDFIRKELEPEFTASARKDWARYDLVALQSFMLKSIQQDIKARIAQYRANKLLQDHGKIAFEDDGSELMNRVKNLYADADIAEANQLEYDSSAYQAYLLLTSGEGDPDDDF